MATRRPPSLCSACLVPARPTQEAVMQIAVTENCVEPLFVRSAMTVQPSPVALGVLASTCIGLPAGCVYPPARTFSPARHAALPRNGPLFGTFAGVFTMWY